MRNTILKLWRNLVSGIFTLRFKIKQKGFTLIELIIVMVIIGIALGLVGAVFYKGKSSLEINTFAKEISASLRYARSHAVAEKKIYSIIFKEDGRAFGLYVNSPGDEKKDEEPSAIIYKRVPASLDIILKNKTDDFKIDFFPQGNSNGGIIEVKDKRDKTFFIIINRVTGRVEVKKNQNLK